MNKKFFLIWKSDHLFKKISIKKSYLDNDNLKLNLFSLFNSLKYSS